MIPTVVVGCCDDPHVVAVLEAAKRSNSVTPIVIDAETLGSHRFRLDNSGFEIEYEGKAQRIVNCRGWLRRLAPESWHFDPDPGSHEGVVRASWTAALTSIVELADVDWLCSLQAIFAAEDKLVQQRTCRRLGIRTPQAVLCTAADQIPAELGQALVVKPLASGHFYDKEGHGHVVHATSIERGDSRLNLLANAPFLVQRRVDARAHLRVVTVLDQAWTAELGAAGISFDWRATEAAHFSFVAAPNPEIESKAVNIADALNVRYSSQDWLIDCGGDAYFLDLNPAGQWLFLPDEVSDAITLAIAEWLTGNV